ncbi:cupin-like domain-containing protein [Sphingomonas montana]|uniref:cupin-like domain-containing protein n=1 Tax=Sphingomonas montana TaxID=1843236 RepID=UPI00096BF9E5|nr:cupin-like domain-containing protein [Sphingomonas montana]
MDEITGLPVVETGLIDTARFEADIATGYVPVVMRGLAADWPAVRAARTSDRAIADHILRFDGGRSTDVMVGPASIAGRFFYDDALSGFNFERTKAPIRSLVEQLLAMQGVAGAPAIYAGAAAAEDHLPGWAAANLLPLPTPDAVPRVWIGNASRVSTHYDVSSNVAVVVAGRRRFCLFPPDQGPNLYVGPLDRTIAGQPVSMVDLEAPDLDRHPRFAAARSQMRVVVLEPGDAIFIPSMWWHDVKALGAFNVLVNYWWGYAGTASPFPALIHAILAIRDLPPGERAAVRGWFDQYVFADDAGQAGGHLPDTAQGVLGPPSPERTAAIRTYLARTLERF